MTFASYDRRGNLLSWAGYSFTWDILGWMTSMQGPGIHRSRFYDAGGERLMVRDGSNLTFTQRNLLVTDEVDIAAASRELFVPSDEVKVPVSETIQERVSGETVTLYCYV